MTPPLTDAELLAYIKRTPECVICLEQINPFNRGYWVHGSAGGYMPYKYKEIARAFHAHEQRVREEEREACAKVCEKWAQKLSHGTGYALRIGADAIRERDNYESTAPQLSTAADRLAPSPEGAGQGEAAEAVGLPKLCPACGADTAFVSAFARTLVYRKTLLTIPDMEQTTCDSCAYTYQTHGQHDRNISKIKAAFLAKQGGK